MLFIIRCVGFIYSLMPLLVIVLCWQICTFLFGPNRCPGVGQTLGTLAESIFQEPIIAAQGGGINGFYPHLIATLRGFAGGFSSGIIIGFALAIVMVQFKAIMYLLEPALEFFRA